MSTSAASALAADKLTFYCSAQEDWCQLMTKEFSSCHWHQSEYDTQKLWRDICTDKGRSRQPQRRCLVGPALAIPHLQAAEEGLAQRRINRRCARKLQAAGRCVRRRRRPTKPLAFIPAPLAMAIMRSC